MRIIVAIAAYNECRTIAGVIADLKAHGYCHIVVCDDGSDDQTGAIARTAGATVLRHLLNRGAGAASRTAIEAALAMGAEVVVSMDADGQHLASDVPLLVGTLVDENVEMAFGNRMYAPERIPRVRRIYNRIANLLTRSLGGARLADTQSGFRAYRARAARLIEVRSSGYEYCSEIAREVRKHKLNYLEVPVTVVYDEFYGSKGQSLYNGFKTAWQLFLRLIN